MRNLDIILYISVCTEGTGQEAMVGNLKGVGSEEKKPPKRRLLECKGHHGDRKISLRRKR